MAALATGTVVEPGVGKAKPDAPKQMMVEAPARKPRPTHEQAQAAVNQAQALKAAGAGNRAVLVAARMNGIGNAVGYRPHASNRELARRAKQIAAGKLKAS